MKYHIRVSEYQYCSYIIIYTSNFKMFSMSLFYYYFLLYHTCFHYYFYLTPFYINVHFVLMDFKCLYFFPGEYNFLLTIGLELQVLLILDFMYKFNRLVLMDFKIMYCIECSSCLFFDNQSRISLVLFILLSMQFG